MSGHLNEEQKERLHQGLRILGRMIARARLRSLGLLADGRGEDVDIEPVSKDISDSAEGETDRERTWGKREHPRGHDTDGR